MNTNFKSSRTIKSGFVAVLATLALYVLPQVASAQVISTAAGNGVEGNKAASLALPGPSAELSQPGGLAFDAAGNLYIGDQVNSMVRKLDTTTGVITTIAGSTDSVEGDSGDGGAATAALLSSPVGVAVDAAGDIYIADDEADRIRKITVATGIIDTVAGTGNAGFSGDGGPATSADLDRPSDIAFDAAGNMYIADFLNHRIRKVDVAGVITTFAGGNGPGALGDGGLATAAQLNRPVGVAVDLAGNVLISDGANHRIREVDVITGFISTIAGTGSSGSTGDGGPAVNAQLNRPRGIFVDPAGDLYIGDSVSNKIRKVDAGTGEISTVAGVGTAGFSGDYGDPLLAELDAPWGVAVSATGDIYMTDLFNNRVRKIAPVGTNNVPTDIGMTNTTGGKIIANVPTGNNIDITTLTTVDADGGNHYYTLAGGAGDDDNALFVIPTTNTSQNDDILIRNSAGMSGDYTIRVQTDDYNGGVYSEAVVVTVTNTTEPTILLVGDNPQLLNAGDAYVELGATATDAGGADITASIVTDSSAVNTLIEGDYSVTYDVTDGSGNAATTVTRTVTVGPDVDGPVITLTGANPQIITVGTAYTELGATATDNVDGDVSGSLVIDASGVNTAAAGAYSVTYDAMDAAGNTATATRAVTVQAVVVPPPPRSSGGGSFGVFGLIFLVGLLARRRLIAS